MDPVYDMRGVRPRASFGQRLLAFFLDVFLLNVVGALVARRATWRSFLISTVLFLAYFALLEGSRSGQTLGKRIVGIRVVDFESGTPIDPGRAFARTIGRWFSGLVVLLGYLWMLWDRDGQTWHDKLASTTVVPVTEFPIDRN